MEVAQEVSLLVFAAFLDSYSPNRKRQALILLPLFDLLNALSVYMASGLRTVQMSALCRSRQELSNEHLLAKIGVDTAENEPLEVWGKIQFIIHSPP